MATVEVGAGELDGALDRSNNSTTRARHAVGQGLRNCASVVAKAELAGANAHNSAVSGAGVAATAARWSTAAIARSRWCLRSRWFLWSGGGGGLFRGTARLGGDWSRSRSGFRGWSRRGAGGENTTTVGWKGRVSRCGSRGAAGSGLGGDRLSGGRLGSIGLGGIGLSRSSELAVTSTHFGHGAASRTSEFVTEGSAVAFDEVLAWLGVVEVFIFGSGALSSGQVGNEHVGKGGKSRRNTLGRSLSSTAADLDGSTVHVELAVTDLVQPGPGKGVLSVGNIGGHLNGESSSAVTIGVSRREVTSHIGRAATDNALDNFPLRLLGGLWVGGNGELAGSAAVNC